MYGGILISPLVIIAEADRGNNEKLKSAVSFDTSIKIVGQANTGLETISLATKIKPDVLVMSLNFSDISPENVVNRILKQNPIPMLLLVATDQKAIQQKIQERFNIGLIDYLELTGKSDNINYSDISITTRIHILSKINVAKFIPVLNLLFSKGLPRLSLNDTTSRDETTQASGKGVLTQVKSSRYSGRNRSSKIVIIGTSTGGPRLLNEIVPKFPKNMPPVIIIQHMPVGFISAFAKRLNRLSRLKVKEAEEDEPVMPGTVYLAPGGKHLEFSKIGTGVPRIVLTEGPLVNFVKPAVDVTLKSAVAIYKQGVVSVILTGMGSDGKEGSKLVKDNRGICLALSEEDSDIYGMNKAIIDAGLADEVLSKKELISGIIRAIEA